MSSATIDPAREAEIIKLGRLVGREPASLGYLQRVPAGEIRVLRELTSAVLFDGQGEVLKRLAAAGKLLPTGVVAAISERAFGPVLAARVAGVMEPQRAADVGSHLAPAFLADVCVQLDPRAAREIVPRMDMETVLAVTGELLDRADYVTLGRFVGAMPDNELAAILEITEDDELVRVCAVAESEDGVAQIFEMLGADRLASLRQRAGEKDLTHEARILRDRLQGSS